MNNHPDKTQENKSQSVSATSPQKQYSEESTFQFVDNRPEAFTQSKLQAMANNCPQVTQLRSFQAMSQSHQVIQLGQSQSSEKTKEETTQKLQSYLSSSGISHTESKDASATKLAKILDQWRKENKIIDFWITNQSNIIEFQLSKYKQMGGACYVIMQSFLRHALTDNTHTDVLDQFNAGNLSESLQFEERIGNDLSRTKEIGKQLKLNMAIVSTEMEKEKEEQDTELIAQKLKENNLLLEERGKISDQITNQLITEKSETDIGSFDAHAVIEQIKLLATGAYEIRLLRDDETGHALGIVKSKDFSDNDWYDFMDPSSMSFSGREASLEKVELILTKFYSSKYTNIKIIKYGKF